MILRTIRSYLLGSLGLGLLLGVGLSARAGEAAGRGEASIDFEQLAAILDYVVSDYPGAVGDRGVRDAEELSEQRGFLREALELSAGLPVAERGRIGGRLAVALAAAGRSAPPSEVVPGVQAALDALAQGHAIARVPRSLPSYERGAALYSVGCVACHAADGRGHTDIAARLSTRPPDLGDPAQSGPLSPRRIFDAVSYGVPGTAMPSFRQSWSKAQRWDAAFYFLTLAHPGARVEEPVDPGQGGGAKAAPRPTFAALAAQSDTELRRESLSHGATPARAEAEVGALRRGASYAAPVAEAPLAACERSVREVARRFAAGDRVGARRLAISAYLDDFEPHEAALRLRDAALVGEVEDAFASLRAGVEADLSPEAVEERALRLLALLERAEALGGRGSAGIPFAAALAIALREGLEATLLLGALLALAAQSERAGARRSVHLGWMAALVVGAVTWWLSGALVAHGGQRRELTEGLVELGTAALLLAASHWLLAQAAAKRFMGLISRRAQTATAGVLGLGGLAFLALYRELFEVVVFFRGLLIEAPGQGRAVLAGALTGLAALVALTALFQRLGRRLRPRPLLLGCGLLLCGLAVVMVGEGVRALQEAGVLGLRPLDLPQLPSLGLFATVQGIAAQALVLAGLLLSLPLGLRRAAPAVDEPRP